MIRRSRAACLLRARGAHFRGFRVCRVAMRMALAFVTVYLVVAVVAIGWFPESPVTVVVGWTIYLALAVITTAWGMAALGVGAAIVAIWWTLTRPRS